MFPLKAHSLVIEPCPQDTIHGHHDAKEITVGRHCSCTTSTFTAVAEYDANDRKFCWFEEGVQ